LKKEKPAENFYKNVFRWDDFFQHLILPLQKQKSIHLETMLIRTDADEYYPFTYRFTHIDILLIEGICLFQKGLLAYYHQKVWIDCSFETGLKRAIGRNAEKLDEEKLIHDYNTWYYPAQRFHFEKDRPRQQADIIFDNDVPPNK
jgi:uridine kinase